MARATGSGESGSAATVLVVLRGNSGSGTSSIAAALRERDEPGAAAVGLVDTAASSATTRGS